MSIRLFERGGLAMGSRATNPTAATAPSFRREWAIAWCRLLVAAFSFVVSWFLASGTPGGAAAAAGVTAVYTVYATGILAWIRRIASVPERSVLGLQAVDLAAFLSILVTLPMTAIPVFPLFVFLVVSAAHRWRLVGALWLALSVWAVTLGVSLVSSRGQLPATGPSGEELFVSALQLGIIGAILVILGGGHERPGGSDTGERRLEEEKTLLARDLHDGVIQSLAAAALRLESARQLLAREPAAADRQIEEIQDLLMAEQRGLRDVVDTLELRESPHPALEKGFGRRLVALTSRIARHWDLHVEVANEVSEIPDERLGRDVRSIVQEALVNSSRHGRASRATVELRRVEDGLRLSIEDDGRGFPFRGTYDLATLTSSKWGPVSLKRRVAALGGRLEITSTAAGARIDVTLPGPEGKDP